MLPQDIQNKRILISVLNWGMGHVSRSIGIIYQLIKQENTVIIACDDSQKKIFSEYFPELQFISHEGYPFQFDGKGNFRWDLTKRLSKLKTRLTEERKQVTSYVGQHNIDVVLSDHRYGFLSKDVPSVFITHQVNLPVKWYEKIVDSFHKRLMSSFRFIWVLDFDDSRLAGRLSQVDKNDKCIHIGPYSRFMLYDKVISKSATQLLVASGPIIYAQLFVDNQLDKQSAVNLKVIAPTDVVVPREFERVANNWHSQDQAFLVAQKIISRPGYSTIMDAHFLECETEFYPTPGQEEQIYLNGLHKKRPSVN